MLETALGPVRAAFPNARWLPSSAWHLTLLFLGSVPPARLDDLRQVLDAAGPSHAPFSVSLGRGGGRERDDDGIAWLGLAAGAGQLVQLAASLQDACSPGMTLGAPPRRTPSAHLTLARRAGVSIIRALRDADPTPWSISWSADRMVLFRSHLGPSGATYEALHEAALSGD